MAGRFQGKGFTLFLGLACVVLSAQVVFLARENRSLKAVVAAEPERARNPSARPSFEVGDVFVPFEIRMSDGSVEPVAFPSAGTKTLLLVIAGACPICPQIVPRWEEVAPFFLDAGVRVLGLRLDGPVDAEQDWFPGVPLASFADLSAIPLAELSRVPLTLLLDETGIVEWVHYGTLTDARVEELLLHLP